MPGWRATTKLGLGTLTAPDPILVLSNLRLQWR